jgi:hypothetical protein
MSKYKVIRIPVEANEALKEKQSRMSEIYKRLTGKNKRLPITKIVTIVSKAPVFMDDTQLIQLFRKGKRARMIC